MNPLQGKKILIVDDEEGIRFILRELLQSEGAEVSEAVNAPSAWKVLNESPPFDIVLTDIIMSGGDGDELLRRIRRERGPQPPVIVITGFTATHGNSLISDGADAVISKPFDIQELLTAVYRFC